MPLMDDLARFVCETRFEDIPQETVTFTKHLTSKIVAAMLLGARTRAGKQAVDYVLSRGGAPEAGIVGTGVRCSLEDAVFVNGITCHAAELEDDQFPSATSDITVFPVIFPLMEKLGLSGRDMIRASSLGLEIMNRVGMFTLSGKGYTDLPFYGVVGAAVTAGVALNLNQNQMTNAVGIALGRASGFIINFGTDAHYIESAGACRDGLTAALLAQRGLTGNPDLEKWIQDLCAGMDVDPVRVAEGLGRPPWRVHEIWVKKYPCCFLTHRHIDMMLDVLADRALSAADVEHIGIHVGPVDFTCNRPFPTDTEDARFSFHHIMAALLVDGDVDSHHFTREKLEDPRFQQAWTKTSVTLHPEWPAEFMSGTAKLEVRLNSGETVVREREQARGGPRFPLTDREFKALYDKYTLGVLTEEGTTETWELLAGLDTVQDPTPLLNGILISG